MTGWWVVKSIYTILSAIEAYGAVIYTKPQSIYFRHSLTIMSQSVATFVGSTVSVYIEFGPPKDKFYNYGIETRNAHVSGPKFKAIV